jgi:hypothetical protein
VDEVRFKALLDAYGADVERWPAPERAAGRRRMAAAQGSGDVKAAAALDALLAESRPAEVSAALMGRVLASAAAARAPGLAGAGAVVAGLGWRARIAAAGLLLVSLGMLAGWSASHDLLEAAAGDALLTVALGEEADDLFAVEEL